MEFVETPVFVRQIGNLLTEDERGLLLQHLTDHPRAGSVIRGSGGLRKLRWAPSGRGKRVGARIIYDVRDPRRRILLLLTFAKNEQSDLTPDQARKLRKYVESELGHEG